MKRVVLIFFIGIASINSGISQNLDSMLMDGFSGLNKKVDRLVYSLEVSNNRLMKANDSLIILNRQLSEQLLEIESGIKISSLEANGFVTKQSNQVKAEILGLKEKMHPRFIVLSILLGLALLLILYLMVIIRIMRKESIENLFLQTDGLSQQNYEILEKAKGIKKIKKNLKELIKEQKAGKKK